MQVNNEPYKYDILTPSYNNTGIFIRWRQKDKSSLLQRFAVSTYATNSISSYLV